MSDYEADVLAWSEQQAALLRRVAGGERVNEAALDWPNIIEEIESVGRSELHAVEALLTQLLGCLLKLRAWPMSSSGRGWEREARVFRRQAGRRYAPLMRPRIDLAGLYADALDGVPDLVEGRPPLPLPVSCPITLDQLLAGRSLSLEEEPS